MLGTLRDQIEFVHRLRDDSGRYCASGRTVVGGRRAQTERAWWGRRSRVLCEISQLQPFLTLPYLSFTGTSKYQVFLGGTTLFVVLSTATHPEE